MVHFLRLHLQFDANTIFVSWKAWATNPNYLSAKGKCKDVGKNLSDLIKRLERYKGASRSKIHLIGHSLGGQASRNCNKLGRIGVVLSCYYSPPASGSWICGIEPAES